MVRHLSNIKSLVFICLIICGFSIQIAYAQIASPGNSGAIPLHETLDQRTITEFFTNPLAGSTSTGQWTVSINGSSVGIVVTGVSVNATGPFGPTANPTTNAIHVQFNASGAVGHSAATPYVLPGETLRIQFTNTGNTLVAAGSSTPVVNFGPFISKNNYAPTCNTATGDVKSRSTGTATGLIDQCSPVNTDFFRWTYQYTLRYRNSSAWVTTDNKLEIAWNAPGGISTVSGFLSDNAGAPNATVTGISNTWDVFTNPSVFLTFRPGFNATTLTLDGTNGAFSYPNPSTVCNFASKAFPLGVNLNATYNCSGGGPLIETNIQFNSFDFDTENNPAQLVLNPTLPLTVPKPTSDQVCLGVNVGMTFTDNTIFNCIGNGTVLPIPAEGAFATPINDQQRHIRFIYGGIDSPNPQGNIRDIRVGGTYGVNNGAQVTDPVTGALVAGLSPNPLLAVTYPLPLIGAPHPEPTLRGYVPTGPGGVGIPDAKGVIQLPASAVASGIQTALITTFSTLNHAVGQRFYVTLQYWGACNPYPTNAPVQINIDFVEIIRKPLPLTVNPLVNPQSICFTNPTAAMNFVATGALATPARTNVNWYKDKASVGTATKMANPTAPAGNALSFPSSSYNVANGAIGGNFTTNNQDGRYHSVWVTQVEGGANTCESDPIEIVIYQQPRLNNLPADIRDVATPNPAPDVCNNTSVIYTEPEAVPVKAILPSTSTNAAIVNFNTENVWSHTFPATVTVTPSASPSGTAKFDYAISPEPTSPAFVTANVGVALRYVPANISVSTSFPFPSIPPSYTYNIAAQACTNTPTLLSQRVFSTSKGGTITPNLDICAGTITGNMTVTGAVGSVLGWERSYNGGAFTPIALTSNLTTFPGEDPSAFNGPGTYKYRVVVQNGPCSSVSTAAGNQNTVIVNPVPPKPTIADAVLLGSDGLTICGDGVNQTVLQSSNLGGIGVIFKWFQGATLVKNSADDFIVLDAVSESGSYTVQVVGPGISACADISNPIVVTIKPLPTAPNPTGGGAVCSGNPAPNIVWTGLTGAAPFQVTYQITKNPGNIVTSFGPFAEPTTTFTIVAPNPVGIAGDTFDYKITGLVDANGIGCAASTASLAALSSRQVTIGGTAPDFDTLPSLTPTSACFNVVSVTDPQLNFSLDPASTLPGSYTLTYKVDGGTNLTKSFAVSLGNGDPNPLNSIIFSEAALNSTGPHVIRVVSIQTPTGCLKIFNIDLNFTVNPLPVVTTQPVAITRCQGTSGGFSVVATGVTLSYQWRENGINLSNSGVYSGATSAALSISDVAGLGGRSYDVVVTDIGVTPSCSAISAARVLTVNNLANVTTQPANLVRCEGTNAIFSVAASGSGLSYQWQISTNGGGLFSNLSNAAPYSGVGTSSLTVAGVTLGLDNNQYRVVLTTTGSCVLNSNAATLTVSLLPTTNYTGLPSDLELCDTGGGGSILIGDLTTFNSQVTNAPTVNWFSDPARLFPVPGFPSATVTVPSTTFYFTATGANTCTNNGSLKFTLNAKPVANNKTYDVCEDSPPGTLQGTINLDSKKVDIIGAALPAERIVTWHPTLGDALSNTNQILTSSNFVITTNTTVFARVFNTLTTCESQALVALVYKARPANNNIIDVNNNTLTGNTLPLSGSINVCESRTAVQFFQIDPAVNPGATYNWTVPPVSYIVPANTFGPGNPSIATPEFEVFPGGSFFRIIRFNFSTSSPPLGFTSLYNAGIPIVVSEGLFTGCDGNPITLTVNVNSAPQKPIIVGGPFDLPSPLNVCANEQGVKFKITNPSAGTYSWTISGNPVPGQTGSSIIVDWGTINGTVKVQQTSGSCVSPESDGYNVIVNPRPFIGNLNKLICSDTPNNVTLAADILNGSVAATSFRITNIAVDPGLSPSSRTFNPAASVTSSEIFSDTFENANGGNLQVRYTVIPVSAIGCEGGPVDIIVTIQPEPTLDPALTKVLCSRVDVYGDNLRVASGSIPASQYFILGITNNGLVPSAGNPTFDATGNTPVFASELANDAWINQTSLPVTVTYFVRPKSANGCLGDPPFPLNVIIDPEPVLVVSPSVNPPPICSGDTPGVTFSSTNLPASTFKWVFKSASSGFVTGYSVTGSGSVITDVLTNPTSSQQSVVYTVTAKSGNCSSLPEDVIILVEPAPSANAINSSACSDVVGGNTFTIDLTTLQPGVNSSGGITFSWFKDNAKTLPINAVSVPPVTAYVMANNVPVFVEVNNGSCKKIVPVNFAVNPTPSVTISATSNFGGFNIKCFGEANGTITASAANGTGAYQFSIDGGINFFNSNVFNGVDVAGNPYIVQIKDAKGCIAISAPINVTQPTPINAGVVLNSNVLCNLGTTGKVTVTGSGGVGGYIYKLIELPSNISGNASGVYTGLRAGSYTFLVTDTNGCQFTTATVPVTEPTPIDALASLTTPVSCNGLSDGMISVNATGGTVALNFTYTLNQAPFTSNSTGSFSGLIAGNYNVTVKDDNNCTKVSNTVTVTQPPVLTIFASVSSQTTCNAANDAHITAVANGGNGTYAYVIAGPTVNTTGASSGIFTSLSPGSYTVSVTDLLGCPKTSSIVTVTQPTVIAPTIFISKPISCNGSTDGEITVNASGGTGAFSFQLLPAGPTNSSGIFAGLGQGTYNFRVTDINNCPATIGTTINQPAPFSASASVTSNYNGAQITCNGASDGVIKVTPIGGTGTLQYVFDQFALTNTTGQFSGIFTNVPAGIGYTFSVKDANNCPASAGPVTVTAPLPLAIVSAIASSPSCVGGSDGQITVVPKDGTVTIPKPYRFQLDQSVSNTSGNASGIYTGLTTGTYTVTVFDANNCSVTTGSIAVNAPTPIAFTSAGVTSNYNGRQIRCVGASDGVITAIATGGAPGGFTYVLKNSLGSAVGVPNGTGVFSLLTADTYTVTATDSKSCPKVSSPITISPPPALTASANVSKQTKCVASSDGEIMVTAGGGTPTSGYSYVLTKTPINIVNMTGATSGIFTGLTAGDYFFTVTDANNCSIGTSTVSIVDPSPILASATVATPYNGQQISCAGATDGVINITASGGTGQLQYVFNQIPTNTTGRFTGQFINVPAGTNYTFTVTDLNSCPIVTIPVSITAPPSLVATATALTPHNGFSVTCKNLSDGQLLVTGINGGTGALSFLLLEDSSNPAVIVSPTSVRFDNLRAGAYRVVITDVNNCSITRSATITQPPDLAITIKKNSPYNGKDISCENASDGSISLVSVAGGAGAGPGYTYVLDQIPGNITGKLNGNFSGLPSGIYTVTVTDGNGCPKTSLPVVLIDPLPLFEGIVAFDKSVCSGKDPDKFVELAPAFGGIGNYAYQWQQSTDNSTFIDVAVNGTSFEYDPPVLVSPITYFKRRITSGGCASLFSNTVSVTVNPLPTATLLPSTTPVCQGGFFLLNFNFTGTAPFYFDYNDGATFVTNRIGAANTPIPILNYQNTTTYALTKLKDFNGCDAILLPPPTVTIPVKKISANFFINGLAAQCTGSTFKFDWTVDQDVEYTWLWPDGVKEVILANARPLGANTISRVISSPNTSGDLNIPITLQAINTVDNCGPLLASKQVTILQGVNISLLVDKTSMCSGDFISLTNATLGATINEWSYRDLTTNTVVVLPSTKDQSFPIINNTAVNNQTYRITYTGKNASCQATDTRDVTVYYNVATDFTNSIVPNWINQNSIVTFTNASILLGSLASNADFRYSWDFGNDSDKKKTQSDNPGPITVKFISNPSDRTIILSAENRLNLSCSKTIQRTIQIPVPPISASYLATPIEACFPNAIKIENIKISGEVDSIAWVVKDQSNKVIARSSGLPTKFDIPYPGKFTISLTVGNTFTGQRVPVVPDQQVTIYDKPLATFTVRPDVVFVPDTQMETFNFTEKNSANEFAWDFGDGGKSMARDTTYTYLLEGKYNVTLIAKFNHGNGVVCKDTLVQQITARQGGQAKIPNAFTPNTGGPSGGKAGNGTFNDVFLPLVKGIPNDSDAFNLQIYDRWGNLIFESTDPQIGWDGYNKDGRLMPAGVYVYKLTLRFSDSQRTTQVGDVTMIH
jgi:gliding motility-associated-like protein